MIQRIQTLFLLIVVCLISLMIFFPLANLVTEDTTYLLKADALVNVMKDNQAELVIWPLFILLIIMILIPLLTIFLFKKRLLQIRFTVFGSVLNLLFYALFFYEVSLLQKELHIDQISYNYWLLALPIIAILFNILAIRRITQDEILIRSLNSNRIR